MVHEETVCWRRPLPSWSQNRQIILIATYCTARRDVVVLREAIATLTLYIQSRKPRAPGCRCLKLLLVPLCQRSPFVKDHSNVQSFAAHHDDRQGGNVHSSRCVWRARLSREGESMEIHSAFARSKLLLFRGPLHLHAGRRKARHSSDRLLVPPYRRTRTQSYRTGSCQQAADAATRQHTSGLLLFY